MARRARVWTIPLCLAGVLGLAAPSAEAQPPRLEIRPPALNLGIVDVGATSQGVLELHNVGGLPLTVQRVSVGPGPFSVSSHGPYTFQPGTFWAITVGFAPTAPGLHTDVIIVDSNDPMAPSVAVPVSGAAPTIAPPGPPVTPVPPGPDRPIGSLGGELAVTGVSVTAPLAGSVFSEDTRVRAEGYIFGSGNGPVTGSWIVNGAVVERFTVDVWGGRPARVVGLQDLPMLSAGRHELVLEIAEPRGVRSPPVRYLVTPGNSHDFRLLLDPGFPTYLRTGGPPAWSWTPRPGASMFDVVIDGRRVDLVSLREWTLSAEVLGALGAGEHRFEVRALSSRREASTGGESVALAVARGRFTLLDAPGTLDLSTTGTEVSWRGTEGPGLFAVVLLDAAGIPAVRKITRRTSAGIGELVLLGPPSGPLRIRIEALNDLGEVVASSAVHEIAR